MSHSPNIRACFVAALVANCFSFLACAPSSQQVVGPTAVSQSITVGMSREQVHRLLGEPDDVGIVTYTVPNFWTNSPEEKPADIWRYTKGDRIQEVVFDASNRRVGEYISAPRGSFAKGFSRKIVTLTWGDPDRINQDTLYDGVAVEYWHYFDKHQFVEFRNGFLYSVNSHTSRPDVDIRVREY